LRIRVDLILFFYFLIPFEAHKLSFHLIGCNGGFATGDFWSCFPDRGFYLDGNEIVLFFNVFLLAVKGRIVVEKSRSCWGSMWRVELIFQRMDLPLELSDVPNEKPRQGSSLCPVLAVMLHASKVLSPKHADEQWTSAVLPPGSVPGTEMG